MPGDADANVVKVIVHEVGDIALGVCQCVAFVTERLGVEQLPAALGGGGDGVLVTRDKVIERGIKRHERSFVRGDGTQQIRAGHRAAEDVSEGLVVLLDVGDLGYGGIQAGLPHLDRIDDRQRRLLLERLRPAVPELRFVVQGVQNGRGVTLAAAPADANRGSAAVGESASGIVAGGASHGAIGGQPPLEEQFLAEGNFLRGLRVIGRCYCSSQLDREPNLLKCPGLGQGSRFGDRRRLSRGL